LFEYAKRKKKRLLEKKISFQFFSQDSSTKEERKALSQSKALRMKSFVG